MTSSGIVGGVLKNSIYRATTSQKGLQVKLPDVVGHGKCKLIGQHNMCLNV